MAESQFADKRIYDQPWYKERLRTKYIKSLGPKDTSKFLHGRNWTFLKDGLDDFRDGLPPPADGDIILQPSKGISPNVKGSNDNLSSIKQPACRRRFTKDETCFSKMTPLQQQRREHIEEVEYGLTQHPLALYPHLEECLPPDMFEEVVDILDPEMNLPSEDGDTYYEETDAEQIHAPNYPNTQRDSAEEDENQVRNPYRWLPRKEDKEGKDKKAAAERRLTSPSQDEHIHRVTEQFCDWVASLGGDNNNIEESTITSLFASGYETKPALSVPIHVVELTNVPPELRLSAAIPQTQQAPRATGEDRDTKKQSWNHSGSYTPSWVKFKYGGWYLDPKSWKMRSADEPLKDPKELKDEEMSEAKKKSNTLDYDLAPMHGARSFMDFIDKKHDSRRPEFLNRVSEIQEQQAREEELRQLAEAAKQRKSVNGRQQAAATSTT